MTPDTARLFVHRYRPATPDDLHETFRGLLREAWDVGKGAHLRR